MLLNILIFFYKNPAYYLNLSLIFRYRFADIFFLWSSERRQKGNNNIYFNILNNIYNILWFKTYAKSPEYCQIEKSLTLFYRDLFTYFV